MNSVIHQKRIRKLEIKQEQLLKAATDLADDWKGLAQRLAALQNEFSAIENPADEVANNKILRLKGEVQRLSQDKNALQQEGLLLGGQEANPREGMRGVALTVISFVGQLMVNICTLGVYGVYQFCSLENRVSILKAQNKHIREKLRTLKIANSDALQQQINFFSLQLNREEEVLAVKNANVGDLLREKEDLKKQADTLREAKKDVEERYNALFVQYSISQQAEDNLELFRESLNEATSVNEDMQKEMGKVQAENSRMVREKEEKEMQLDNILQQLQAVNQQAQRVQGLEAQLGILQGGDEMRKRLGPVPAKYTPVGAELELAAQGAIGIEDYSETNKENWGSYARLYNGLATAADIFKTGYSNALKTLFEMAETKAEAIEDNIHNFMLDELGLLPEAGREIVKQGHQKIMLNRSLGTPASEGAHTIYRFLALELLKGGKVVADCQGYEFHLNNKGVKLLPTQPEKVLQIKNVEGRQQPFVVTHFQRRDDFTPSEEILSHTAAAYGMDPIAAKCLLVKLSHEEHHHLFNLLMDPVIEDNHPDYQRTLEYMRKLPKEHAERILTLHTLICDMGTVLQAKFDKKIGDPFWQNYLDLEDFELKPFVKDKKEEWEIRIKEQGNRDKPIVEWKLNEDLLALRKRGGSGQQEDFLRLIISAKEKYQRYFTHLKRDLLELPMGKDLVVERVTNDYIKQQYRRTHPDISGAGCLYSGLMAILIKDSTQLKPDNVRKLKRAMAAYLDDPKHAEMFQGALRNDHKISVADYQRWLRDEKCCYLIDNYKLTPLQIEIAAYTLGVRIALFTLPNNRKHDYGQTVGKVDEYGRLVPTGDVLGNYFGPNTREVFFMTGEDGFTYHGIFPKQKLTGAAAKALDPLDLEAMKEIEKYWLSIPEGY